MSMNEWAIGQANLGNHEAAFAGRKLARIHGEIPLPGFQPFLPSEDHAQLSPEQRVLDFAAEFFSTQLHTPENLTKVRDTIWAARQTSLESARVIIDLTFEPCAYSQEEIDELEAQGRRLGYLPPELATQEQRHLLGTMFPEMQNHSVKVGNTVTNEVDRSGWFDYEITIDAPHHYTKENALRNAIEEKGKKGMNLNEYIIASQDSKVLTDKYLDETSTWTRLIGSRDGGYGVGARFDDHGYLNVNSHLLPLYRLGDLGGRSVGVPKAA